MITRRSKISRFPEAIINQINEFLDANTEYQRIIDWLVQQGHTGIEPYHLSRWKDSGYQDWLHAQEDLDELDRKLQWAARQTEKGLHSSLHRAAMAVIALKLYDAFNRTDSTDIHKMLDNKPEKIATLINSFSRYSHEVLEQEKFLDDQRERLKLEQQTKSTGRERISDEARQRVYEELRLALRLPAGAIPAPAEEPPKVAESPPQPPAEIAPGCA